MRAWLGSWIGPLVATGAIGAACGGAVSVDDGPGGASAAPGTGGAGATGGTGLTGGTGGVRLDAGKDADARSDREPDTYVDPGCPDVEPPPVIWECDPFATPSGCPQGEACYPFVENPGHYCNQEQYGAICTLAGTGTQGDPCSPGACAAGYLCVKGAQPGLSCVKLCDPYGPNSCPPGMLCGHVDVEGIGGCF